MSAKRPKKSPSAKPQLREPTEAERAAGAAALSAQAARPARPSLTIAAKDDGGKTISNPHSDWKGWSAQISEAFGTTSDDYAHLAFARLGEVAGVNGSNAQMHANALLAFMAAIAPRDELEASIGEQIYANHCMSMEMLHRAKLNAGQHYEAASVYAGIATKLSRTMTAQVEALAKLRNGGKQQVIVKHVYVDARGSQNVIGSDIHGGRGGAALENHEQPLVPNSLAAPADAIGQEMWSEEPARHAVSGAGDAG